MAKMIHHHSYSIVTSDPMDIEDDFLSDDFHGMKTKNKNWSMRKLLIQGLFYLPFIAIVSACIYLYIVKHHRYAYCEDNDYTYGMVPTSFHRSSIDCKLLDKNKIIGISDTPTVHRIALLGDSLIAVPDKKFDLVNDLRMKLSDRYPALTFDVQFVFFSHIIDLKNMMCEHDVIAQADSVILYWDSDIRTEYTKEIIQYTQDLAEVISTLKQAVKHVAFAGPGLIGEAPVGDNKLDECADTYREIHRNISSIFNVSFIDIRRAFIQADRRKGWKKPFGYLTLPDGHHPSKLGTLIEEGLFYDQLERWYSYGD